MNSKPSVLLIASRGCLSLIEVVALFVRAGFDVDVLTKNQEFLKSSGLIRNLYIEKNSTLAPKLAIHLIAENNYVQVHAVVDELLKAIVNSDLSDEDKLKLLPVVSTENFKHLYSKVRLSELFLAEGVPTPQFQIINHQDQLDYQTIQLAYPFMIKIDVSGAGDGVFKCDSPQELQSIKTKLNPEDFPLVIQEYIPGELVDMSAFYKNARLVYFTYSRIEECVSQYGVSKLRTYIPKKLGNPDVISELKLIGETLGADGFSNISCIKSSVNGKHYYIEADLRPNAWVNFGQHIGHDMADFLMNRDENFREPELRITTGQANITAPYCFRMTLFELLINKHNVWNFIPSYGYRMLWLQSMKNLKKLLKRPFKLAIAILVNFQNRLRCRIRYLTN